MIAKIPTQTQMPWVIANQCVRVASVATMAVGGPVACAVPVINAAMLGFAFVSLHVRGVSVVTTDAVETAETVLATMPVIHSVSANANPSVPNVSAVMMVVVVAVAIVRTGLAVTPLGSAFVSRIVPIKLAAMMDVEACVGFVRPTKCVLKRSSVGSLQRLPRLSCCLQPCNLGGSWLESPQRLWRR